MKPINKKSKLKSGPFEPSPSNWYKLSFFFESAKECNEIAMAPVIALRETYTKVYFARYNSAAEARLDVFFFAPNFTPHDRQMITYSGDTRWFRIEGPVPCDGSPIHALGFDLVKSFLIETDKLDAEARRVLWCDLLHWMHNMAGYDYTDEARCNLYAIDRIIQIFEKSIKMGNEMAWFKRPKSKHPARGKAQDN